jgi:aminoglycoside phosphotransferase (APT) family kinase protein
MLSDCVDFLASLYVAGPNGADRELLARDTEVVVAFCSDAERDIRLVSAQLERTLADLPRGFGHGDFWGGNLLTNDGRLAGVVDWAAAGPGRLPLLDFLHLQVSAKVWATNSHFGAVIVKEFLPWARAGGDDASRAYCRQLGLDLTVGQLEALVLAYWLDRVAYDLKTFARPSRPSWLNWNVVDVLRAVEANRYGSGER